MIGNGVFWKTAIGSYTTVLVSLLTKSWRLMNEVEGILSWFYFVRYLHNLCKSVSMYPTKTENEDASPARPFLLDLRMPAKTISSFLYVFSSPRCPKQMVRRFVQRPLFVTKLLSEKFRWQRWPVCRKISRLSKPNARGKMPTRGIV